VGSSKGQPVLRVLGGLCATAGVLAWIGLAWTAFADFGTISAESDEGGRLMRWAVGGTLLMILGTVIMHLGANAQEQAEREESTR